MKQIQLKYNTLFGWNEKGWSFEYGRNVVWPSEYKLVMSEMQFKVQIYVHLFEV